MAPCESAEKALSLIKNEESKVLGLLVGKHNITPGQHVPKVDAQEAPELSFDVSTGVFMVICVDLDAPFTGFNVLSPILHWIQPGYKPQGGTTNLKTEMPFVVNWGAPGPPPGSGPHRYVFLLYEQPEGFEGSKHAPTGGKGLGIRGRIRYDLAAFEREVGLRTVVAANYFCSN